MVITLLEQKRKDTSEWTSTYPGVFREGYWWRWHHSVPNWILEWYYFSGFQPHILTINKNCVIILMRNLNQKRGHCNGTRYIVTQVPSRIIYATKLVFNANDPNATIMIPKIPIHANQDDLLFILKWIQWPVQIAYVVSMNKSQGQTFNKCGLLLPNSVFAHGQLYVGLSRYGEPNNFFIYFNQDEYSCLPNDKFHTINVVYPEVLG